MSSRFGPYFGPLPGERRRSTREKKAPARYTDSLKAGTKRKADDSVQDAPKEEVRDSRGQSLPYDSPCSKKIKTEEPIINHTAVKPQISEAQFIAVANRVIDRNSEKFGAKSWVQLDEKNFCLETVRPGESGLVHVRKASFAVMTTTLIKEARRRYNKLRYAPRCEYNRKAVKEADHIHQMWKEVKKVGPNWKPKPLNQQNKPKKQTRSVLAQKKKDTATTEIKTDSAESSDKEHELKEADISAETKDQDDKAVDGVKAEPVETENETQIKLEE